MNCREFTIEFEERRGAVLTEAAVLHLKICADCEKMSREQTRVWQMIDALKRVEAPKTFDFTVKARIANSKPADYKPRFLPVLRYALPLSIVVLIFGFIVFRALNLSNENAAPRMAETVSPASAEKEFVPAAPASENQVAVADPRDASPISSVVETAVETTKSNREKPFIRAGLQPKSRVLPRREQSKNNSDGGSFDKAGIQPKVFTQISTPNNSNSNKTIENSPNVESVKFFTATEILSMLGIESVSENGRLQVKAVKPDSLAARSNVEIGDVVEAINGKKISGELFSSGTIEGKTLTILRGGKKIEIALRN